MKIIFTIGLVFFIGSVMMAQGEIDKENKILLRNESSISFSLNTNGLGFGYRYGKHINAYKKWLFQSNFNYIKGDKEVKTRSYVNNYKSFTYGKLNSFYSIGLSTGIQKEVFSKIDKGGVAICYYYLGGISLGIQKPKLYEVSYEVGVTEVEDFETYYHKIQNYHAGYILGNSSYFDGIKDTKLIPGLSLESGVNFEFSSEDNYLNAIEVGGAINYFLEDVKIMYSSGNDYPQLFVSLFLRYRMGKIINARHIVD